MNLQFFYTCPSYVVLTGELINDTNMIMPFLSDKLLLHQVCKDLRNAQASVLLQNNDKNELRLQVNKVSLIRLFGLMFVS